MITPFLFVKNRLVGLWERINDEPIRIALENVILDLDQAIDQQAKEDLAHRDEVKALMGTYDPVRRRREKECAGS